MEVGQAEATAALVGRIWQWWNFFYHCMRCPGLKHMAAYKWRQRTILPKIPENCSERLGARTILFILCFLVCGPMCRVNPFPVAPMAQVLPLFSNQRMKESSESPMPSRVIFLKLEHFCWLRRGWDSYSEHWGICSAKVRFLLIQRKEKTNWEQWAVSSINPTRNMLAHIGREKVLWS